MDRLRKRFVMFVVPMALILFASFILAQGPPNPCANVCRQNYTNAVKGCHGDPACLADARAAALACVQGCTSPR
jgi:hypothetical protein